MKDVKKGFDEDKVYIMRSEPLPNITTEEWMAINNYCETESDLANAYAGASNMFWWLEDEMYDEDVTQEEIESYKDWKRLLTELDEKIISVLRKENLNIDFSNIGLKELTPFMSRNGFFDGNGWWIKNPRK